MDYISNLLYSVLILNLAHIIKAADFESMTGDLSMDTILQSIDIPICTHAIQSFPGEIGSGNYTYYRLNVEGNLRIELTSQTGDADLYISSTELRPDFENYELQSVTCGLDDIIVRADMKRPVGIGVYGHVSQAHSTYTLTLYTCGDEVTEYMYRNETVQDDESPLWTILINILKILLDVLL